MNNLRKMNDKNHIWAFKNKIKKVVQVSSICLAGLFAGCNKNNDKVITTSSGIFDFNEKTISDCVIPHKNFENVNKGDSCMVVFTHKWDKGIEAIIYDKNGKILNRECIRRRSEKDFNAAVSGSINTVLGEKRTHIPRTTNNVYKNIHLMDLVGKYGFDVGKNSISILTNTKYHMWGWEPKYETNTTTHITKKDNQYIVTLIKKNPENHTSKSERNCKNIDDAFSSAESHLSDQYVNEESLNKLKEKMEAAKKVFSRITWLEKNI